MNGPHDVGGMMGFGPVNPELDEPVFHGEWEKRALGLTLCAGAVGGWNLDESRHARENRRPADYYASSYYEIWTKALEELLIRHGVVGADEVAAGASLRPGPSVDDLPGRVLAADRVVAALRRGGPVERDVNDEARFTVGQAVRARDMHPSGHTRLPRYVRGKRGVVESVHGAHIFPDAHAHGLGEQPQWLYTVRFDGTEVWGPDAEAGLTISVDAWESYLLPASERADR